MIKFFSKIFIVTLITALFASCGENKEQVAPQPSKQQQEEVITLSREQLSKNGMKLVAPSQVYIPTGISCSGTIDVPPQNRATISPLMDGYVKQTRLLVGDKVEKGQVLLVLENPDYISLQQQYMELSESLAYLEAEYQRQLALREENITSTKNYLKAESEYKSSLARHKGVESKLRLLGISTVQARSGNFTSTITLRAPISGMITEMNVNKGTYVHASAEIMEIVSSDHMHLELTVYEKDVLKINPGQAIVYRIPESSDELYKGEVYLVGSALQEDRSIAVHGHMDETVKSRVLTGMFVEATIVTDSTAVMALPSTAFIEQGESAYVLLLEREDSDHLYFSKHPVPEGVSYGGMRAIGLQESGNKTSYLDNAYLIQALD
jgi:cobalt-zinc-cadmium efflux system membrane fusion protein